MWSLVRQGLRWGRRRRTARVVDESALGGDDGAAAPAVGGAAVAATTTLGGALARALLAMACAIRFDGEDGGATEEAWAASGSLSSKISSTWKRAASSRRAVSAASSCGALASLA